MKKYLFFLLLIAPITSFAQTQEVQSIKKEIQSIKMQLQAVEDRLNTLENVGQQKKTQTQQQPASGGQCKATTKKKTRCSRAAKSNGYCWQHGS
jgi:hypothetical protein